MDLTSGQQRFCSVIQAHRVRRGVGSCALDCLSTGRGRQRVFPPAPVAHGFQRRRFPLCVSALVPHAVLRAGGCIRCVVQALGSYWCQPEKSTTHHGARYRQRAHGRHHNTSRPASVFRSQFFQEDLLLVRGVAEQGRQSARDSLVAETPQLPLQSAAGGGQDVLASRATSRSHPSTTGGASASTSDEVKCPELRKQKRHSHTVKRIKGSSFVLVCLTDERSEQRGRRAAGFQDAVKRARCPAT